MENPCYITGQYDIQKHQAFPLRGTGFVGFINGKRPRKAEAKQHDDFKNAHKYSSMPFDILIIIIALFFFFQKREI
jgi:hypothetical protein